MNTITSPAKKTFSANKIYPIGYSDTVQKSIVPLTWVKEHTAILAIHGIGNQNPLETLDGFGRGLLNSYFNEMKIPKSDFTITHKVAIKPDASDGTWFDNFLRIEKKGETSHIDLYEYYWASQTE